ncbi:Alcohol oxidase [Leucoagaricus sp. SymC.cos]|nr:Alcohol oxidase [Leucoagaricus sp. SymC.cos]
MGHPEEVDVIVCGGGPAGSVVAGRLAFADPNLKVMLIEGGANNRDDPWVYRPGIFVRNMQRDGVNDKATFYVDTEKSKHLRGRRSIVPAANILGGGSSINFQMYTRASGSDWDDFKQPGWTAKDLLPLMKRLENYQKPVNNDTHGYDGPIAISNGGTITALAQDFLRASDSIGIPFSVYRVSNESHTVDDFLRGVPEVRHEIFQEWEVSPEKARLSSNSIDAGFKIRPTEEELKEMGPEFKALWDRYFKDKPDKPVMFGSIVSGAYADHTLLPPGKYITMFQYLEYPASRGKIHVQSQNPYKEPFFDSGFMNNKADFAPIRWSYKVTREVARRMDAFRGELTSHHPHFHPDSPAASHDIDLKTAKGILPDGFTVGLHMGTWHKPGEEYNEAKTHEKIKYSAEDDKAIDDWISDHVETTWHSLGTCAMKPREEGGVVDARLNVYGTQNLKCVDLSICPDNLGTNTYSSALLVGEKGADLLAEDLGLKLKFPHAPVPHAPIPKGVPTTQLVR